MNLFFLFLFPLFFTHLLSCLFRFFTCAGAFGTIVGFAGFRICFYIVDAIDIDGIFQ